MIERFVVHYWIMGCVYSKPIITYILSLALLENFASGDGGSTETRRSFKPSHKRLKCPHIFRFHYKLRFKKISCFDTAKHEIPTVNTIDIAHDASTHRLQVQPHPQGHQVLQ